MHDVCPRVSKWGRGAMRYSQEGTTWTKPEYLGCSKNSILLEDSKPVFGKNNLRQVDIAAAFDIMDEIRDLFPAEFSQARQIVRERQSLLDDAEVEANRMIEDARSQAITIASEQEIVRISQQQADTILADARELERQTRAGAEDYADEVFGHIEQSLDTLLNNTRRCRDRLNAAR